MNATRTEAARVIDLASELADIAANTDLDTAGYTLELICRTLGVEPGTVATWRKIRSEITSRA